MKLLDECLNEFELDDLKRMLDGNIVRICISDDVEEIVRHLGFAHDRLSMIAYSRVKKLLNCEGKNGIHKD